MADKRIGVAAMGGDAKAVVERIQQMESMGVPAVWLTTGGAGLDGLTIFSAAGHADRQHLAGHLHHADLATAPSGSGAAGAGHRQSSARPVSVRRRSQP